jgi:hypothetical protein
MAQESHADHEAVSFVKIWVIIEIMINISIRSVPCSATSGVQWLLFLRVYSSLTVLECFQVTFCQHDGLSNTGISNTTYLS